VNEISEFLTWVLLTLSIVSLSLCVSRRYGVEVAVGIYASLTIISNVIAFKRVAIGQIGSLSILAPAGVIVYASTFLVTDLICEVYGKEKAKRAVLAGFLSNLIAVISFLIAIKWTPAPQTIMPERELEAFNTVLSLAPRIVLASIIAFIISQTHDVYAFHFWKKVTGGKYLWIRNNLSTVTSQGIDTFVFIFISFYGILDLGSIAALMVGQYVAKVSIALVDTPFIYLITYAHQRSGVDPNHYVKK